MHGLQKLSACHDHHGNTPKSVAVAAEMTVRVTFQACCGRAISCSWFGALDSVGTPYNTDCPTNAQCKQTASMNRSDALKATLKMNATGS